MPGAPTHISVADKIYSTLGSKVIRNLPLFFGGCIAPDAIHAKPNYTREDKRRTHLTEGISIDQFQNPEKLRVFYGRVNTFIKKYYLPAEELKDLYLGYVVHLLTDELFNTTVRASFNRLMFNDGLDKEEQEYFSRVLQDVDGIDKLIISRYNYSQNISKILDSAWNYEIKDYIDKEEINNSKLYTINKYFKREASQVVLKYYSFDEAINFVNYAAENILNRLYGKTDIISIF